MLVGRGGGGGGEAVGLSSTHTTEYKVHMAVLTANMGKRLSVLQGNLMSTTVWKAMRRHGGSVSMAPRTEEVRICLCVCVNTLQRS